MNNTVTIQTTRRAVVSTQTFYRLFVALWWTRYTVLDFIRPIVARVPFVGQFSNWVIPFVMTVVLLLAIPYIKKRVHYGDLLFYLAYALMILGTMLFLPKNCEYIEEDLWRIMGLAVPVYFIGLAYDHEAMEKDLYWCSALGVIIMCAYMVFLLNSNRDIESDNMDASYKVLPSVLYLFYWAYRDKQVHHWLLAFAGTSLIFSYGTRGPIMIIAVYCGLQMFRNVFRNKRNVWHIIGAVVLPIVAVFLIMTDTLTVFAIYLMGIFEELGLSTRIFDYFLKGEFVESLGRAKIANAVTESIANNVFLGNGFYGDRVVAGNYAHNLVLELWCQFGIFIGSAMLVAVAWITISGLRRIHWMQKKDMYLLLLCLVFVKLMLSSSYAVEPYLYFVLGMAVDSCRSNKEMCYER